MNPAPRPQQVDQRDYDDLYTLACNDYDLTSEDRRALVHIWQEDRYPWQGPSKFRRLRISDPDNKVESPLPGMSASAFGSHVTKLAELGFFEKMDPADPANHLKCDHEHGYYWCQVHIRNMRLPILPLPERPPKPEPEQQGPAAPSVEPGVSCPKCGGPCRASAYKCTRFGCGHEFTALERAKAEKKAARILHVVPEPEPVAPPVVPTKLASPAPPEDTTVSPEPAPPMRHVTHHAAGVYHLAPRCDLDAEHVAGVRCFACLDVPDAPAPEPAAPRPCFPGSRPGAIGSEPLARTLPAPVKAEEWGRGPTCLDGGGKLAGGSGLALPRGPQVSAAPTGQPAQPANRPRLSLVEMGEGP